MTRGRNLGVVSSVLAALVWVLPVSSADAGRARSSRPHTVSCDPTAIPGRIGAALAPAPDVLSSDLRSHGNGGNDNGQGNGGKPGDGQGGGNGGNDNGQGNGGVPGNGGNNNDDGDGATTTTTSTPVTTTTVNSGRNQARGPVETRSTCENLACCWNGVEGLGLLVA